MIGQRVLTELHPPTGQRNTPMEQTLMNNTIVASRRWECFGEEITISVERAHKRDPRLLQQLLDLDLHTFTEPSYTKTLLPALLQFGQAFLLKHGDTLIGASLCIRDYANPHGVVIVSMGLLPGWRGQGLARYFVEQIVSLLMAEGFEELSLQVGQDNRRAIRLYEALGFTVRSQGQWLEMARQLESLNAV